MFLGKEIAALVNEELNSGVYEIEWDASDYSERECIITNWRQGTLRLAQGRVLQKQRK